MQADSYSGLQKGQTKNLPNGRKLKEDIEAFELELNEEALNTINDTLKDY